MLSDLMSDFHSFCAVLVSGRWIVLFANLLFVHMVADFWLQGKRTVANKKNKCLSGRGIYIHVFWVFVTSWAAAGEFDFFALAIFIAGSHFLVDYIKIRCSQSGFVSFAVDQIVHLALLLVVSVFRFMDGDPWSQFSFLPRSLALVIPVAAIGFVAITNPSNILIKEIFAYCKIFKNEMAQSVVIIDGQSAGEDRFRNAGAIVGILERLLVLIFIMKGNYQAIGFVLAAKSILRFKLDNAAKAEYVLVGTMLSLVLVVAVAIVIGCALHYSGVV